MGREKAAAVGGRGGDVPGVTVRDLLRERAGALSLRPVAGRGGSGHTILIPRVQRPGLALNGYTDYLQYGRVQIMGNSEIGFLVGLEGRRRAAALRRLVRCRVSCFVVTSGLEPPSELLREADRCGVPVLVTSMESTPFIKQLTAYLEDRLAPQGELHGVLVDVFGLGVLIMGESGIGKSECALDLVDRGHRLVADDVTVVKRLGETLLGSSPELTRYHMEFRGLGVINIKDLYGVSSIRSSKRLELVVRLERWEADKDYDRLGLQRETFAILGVALPLVRMPVAPGRSIALLVEVAARNQMLKERGFDAARALAERVDGTLGARRARPGSRPAKGKARRSIPRGRK